jgi:hypothetical protein
MGILERLEAGEVIIGDGSYVNTLEKRGYVKVSQQCTTSLDCCTMGYIQCSAMPS